MSYKEKINPPICPIHNKSMFLLTGCHRESGGFVDNYWKCFERNCQQSVAARTREEAEEQTELQNRMDMECKEIENTCACKAGYERIITEHTIHYIKCYYKCNKCGKKTRVFTI